MSKADFFKKEIAAVRRAKARVRAKEEALVIAQRTADKANETLAIKRDQLKDAFCDAGGILLEIRVGGQQVEIVGKVQDEDLPVTRYNKQYARDSQEGRIAGAALFSDHREGLTMLTTAKLISPEKWPLIYFHGEYCEWLDGEWKEIEVPW